MDLPVWQSLFELKDYDFTIIAVAMDRADAARPWIEAARATYPCLIDADHHLGDLYNLVNVPQAVWIDPDGQIVRPPEIAGSNDGFRKMDRTTFTFPEGVVAERDRLKRKYFDAIRDWAVKGDSSAYALDARTASARLTLPDPAIARAHALFKLGQALQRRGDQAQAERHFAEAVRLHPDSWAMFRQTAAKDARGLASGAEFWARVDALGDRPYYPPADLDDATVRARPEPGVD